MCVPPAYAELHALSHFSFRRAASSPAELVQRAHALGYRALALTDACSMAGVVRAHEAAQAVDLPLIIGSELVAECGAHLVLLAESQAGYARICRQITQARRRAKKGRYCFRINDLGEPLDEVSAIWKAPVDDLARAAAQIDSLRAAFGNRLWLGATRRLVPGERAAFERLDAFGRRHGLPRLACGDVRMHRRSRRALLDVLTALDCNRPLAECGRALAANGEAHLRTRETLARLYPADWLAETLYVAERCRFRLDALTYRYPKELVPAPRTPTQHLRRLTLDGMKRRWPGGPPDAVRAQVARELALIEEMGFEAFFLTVHDVVEFARGRGILCQGRGSAANSAVCYCLRIT